MRVLHDVVCLRHRHDLRHGIVGILTRRVGARELRQLGPPFEAVIADERRNLVAMLRRRGPWLSEIGRNAVIRPRSAAEQEA